jgi:hypothetical protein
MRSTLTPAGEDIVVDHRNLNHIWFRAYRLNWQPDPETVHSDNAPDYEECERTLLKTKPALAWDAPLPDDKDFAEHLTRLPAPLDLAPGFYAILASGRPEFSIKNNTVDIVPVHVTKFAMIVGKSGNGSINGIVTDAVTGAPVAGMEVMKYRVIQDKDSTKKRTIKSPGTRSDTDGCFSFPCASDDHGSILLAASRDGDRVIARTYDGDEKHTSPPPDTTAVVFTDRAIYRPGQTIHFKGILCHTDQSKGIYQTVAGKPVTVEFSVPGGKLIDTLQLVSNDRGSFTGSFTAPSGNLLGRFSIDVGEYGGIWVRVEEYKRPKFFAKIMPPAAPAVLGKQVEVKGKAEAYTTAAVDGAKVEWQVTRRATCPAWVFWMDPAMKPPGWEQEIARGSSVTAADGGFSIAFEAAPDPTVSPAAAPVFTFEITADITEPSGETRSVREFVAVAYTSLRASVTTDCMPEAGKECRIKVRTETYDGDGRPANGTLKIHKLVEPQTCPRRDDWVDWNIATDGKQADPSDPNHWPTGELVAEIQIQTDANGEIVVGHVLPAGLYRLVFETKDSNNHPVKAVLGLQVLEPDGVKFPTKVPFFADSPQWKVEPGKTFTLFWGCGHPEARACIEWRKGSQLLKREWSAPGRTQQAFTWQIDEALQGGFSVTVLQTTMNRMHTFTGNIEVPWSNKELELRWEHLTSKLDPGAKDTWTAVISGPDNKPVDAEMVATLYDASLDAFLMHNVPDFAGYFRTNESPDFDHVFSHAYCFVNGSGDYENHFWSAVRRPYRHFVDQLDYRDADNFVISSPYPGLLMGGAFATGPMQYSVGGYGGISNAPTPGTAGFRSGDAMVEVEQPRLPQSVAASPDYNEPAVTVTARRNLQETAFFYPQLTSDADGKVRISFTMPEALTTWKFLGFAHDKELRSGLLEGTTVTSKDLMVQPNPPRFLREGDVLDFTVKITNRGEQAQSGTARLTLADAATQADRTAALGISAADQAFAVPAQESRVVSWRLTVPDGAGFLTYKAVAAGEKLSDGEEGWLPVLPRRLLVTESISLPVREPGTKSFSFTKLKESGNSPTMQNKFVHVQAVANPAWYAVMALPYLMEFPHECAEQTFHRYYANALAKHIARSDPEIRRVFDQWRNTPTLDSPLEKNSDLKGILLEETPWLREAHDESQARRNVGLLFDDNHMASQLERSLFQLQQMQRPDGLWPWFQGGDGNETISLGIAAGFARLRAFGVATDITPALKCLQALDHGLTKNHAAILRRAEKDPAVLDQCHLDPAVAYYLYTRTFFLKDKAVSNNDQVAFDFFTTQAKRHWTRLSNRMSRAHAALALWRLGDQDTARLITRSLKEHATVDADNGMHWIDDDGDGWWWWQAPIETQAMMIEAFREIDHDAKAVADCQTWLIQQKQTRNWHSTTATADAVQSLLIGGSKMLDGDPSEPLGSDAPPLSGTHSVEITMAGEKLRPPQSEAGTGFFETRFAGPAVKPALGDISLTKTGSGVSWASVHWQYLEDIAKITSHHTTGLSLEKSLFIRRVTPSGMVLEPLAGKAKVGDELVTRLVLRNDRAMEFVHLKDARGSGTEPLNVLSGYRSQDGLAYYEVTRDTASHFFIDRLPPGTHVFETSVRIQHAGVYRTGTAEIRCLYAPEFNAHSGSVAIEVAQ